MRLEAIVRLAVVLCLGVSAAGAQDANPYESDLSADSSGVPAGEIDRYVLAAQKERQIAAANRCSDEVFLRRVYLDVIGTLPTAREVIRFTYDRRPNKRAAVIEALFGRDEFADYWALKWGDLLRIKSEFPINLWPNAVQAYHRWVRDAIRRNMPYDRFVRELLTSSGSNFRVPQVNFYRAIQGREPAAISRAVALTFMGVRLEKWPPERRAKFETFFSRVAYKGTGEWKEVIVLLDPAPAGPLAAVFPDGTEVVIPADEDPRRVFADWLVSAKNSWFARNIANRIWYWLMGRGIVHEADDVRPDNPASIPKLLDYLASELVASGYDLHHLYRLILNSRTYQQSSIAKSDGPEAEAVFASYPVRRLEAEVLLDAICWVTGTGESYASAVPEPFTFLPDWQRSIGLADGSITSPFLELFGRPSRDTGLESERSNEPSDAQRLHLFNSSHMLDKIKRSRPLRAVLRTARGSASLTVRALYRRVLSRLPTKAELSAATAYIRAEGTNWRRRWDAVVDLVWTLINNKEFLYRH